MNNEDISGIYLIKNTQTNKYYIGESKHIYTRWNQHKEQLQNGIHYNKSLQEDYDKYGPNCFEFILCQKLNDDSNDKITLKAKLLILEHIYLNKIKKYYEVYNIRDSMNDVLLDTDYYMSDSTKRSFIIKLKEKILAILRSHSIVVNDNHYELQKKTKLSDLFSKIGVRYKRNLQKFIDLIPPDEFKRIIEKRIIRFAKDGQEITECAYIVKDVPTVTKYIEENFYSGLVQDNISITNMYKRLKMLNIITSYTCPRNKYYNILVRNNIIENCYENIKPTKWAMSHGLIYYSSNRIIIFSQKGIELIERIFSNIFVY